MTWSYQYTPHILPSLTSAAFLAILGVGSIRSRTAPGALPFSIMVMVALLWILANALVLAGTDDTTRIFWFKLQTTFVLPLITATLCFVIEYSGLGKWLTRGGLAFLAIPPLAFALLALTNEMHHLVWTRIWFDGTIRAEEGPARWAAIGYGYFLSLVHLMVLVRLFMRSPSHRWIAIGLILSLLATRAAAFFNFALKNPFEPINPLVLVLNVSLLPYAYAIFRFRMFDVAPLGRDTAIECMAHGLIVLDVEHRIADVNKTVEALLGVSRARVIGRRAEKILGTFPDLLEFVRSPDGAECEMTFGDADARCYRACTSPIIDRRGFKLGRLITLLDITEQKRAQAQLLDQERALAMLRERELLARELHDGVGQMAAAAHLQAMCASELLARGDAVQAEACLHSVAEATRGIKRSVRDYLLGVKTCSSGEQGFITGIRRYIDQYSRKYEIHTELITPPELEAQRIDSTIEAQLQPIIQEALINIGKHSGARNARVVFAPCEEHVLITIEDDGRSFDLEAINEGQGFGLRSMRGRAEALGGHLEVSSVPGKGTRISIQAPWRKEQA